MDVDIEDRKQKFEAFLEERVPVLFEFAKNLGFKNPQDIFHSPQSFLASLSDWLSKQEISEANKPWAASRFGYFIGEYFVVRFDGGWQLCDSNDSRHYGQYVVGDFSRLDNPNVIINPMEAACNLVNEPKGRSLKTLIADIEASLNSL